MGVLAIVGGQAWAHLGLRMRAGSCRSWLWWPRSLLHAGCKHRGLVSARAAHTGWAPAAGADNTRPCPPRHQWQTGEAIKPAGSWHTSPLPNVPSSPPAPHNASHPLPAQPGPHAPHVSLPGDAGRRDFAQHLSSGGRSRLLARAARDARLCRKAAAGTGSATGGALSHGPSLGMFFLLAVGA